MQKILQLLNHHRQATGVIEILHQILAGGHQIDQQRQLATEAVEVVQGQLNADAPGEGQQVNDAVGRTTDGRVDLDGVLKGFAPEDGRHLEIFADHLDDARSR